tara:strand:- start:103 stop:528 length:426 start_codon:yes stop_codon:yes gene_type:complete
VPDSFITLDAHMAQGSGRPTKYSEAIQKKADDYLTSHDSLVPTAAGLAIHLGVTKKTLYNWADTTVQFLHTLHSLNDRQESLLVNGGLGGEFNATISKLMLANHGYREKTEQDVISSNGSMTPSKIERIIIQADQNVHDSV